MTTTAIKNNAELKKSRVLFEKEKVVKRKTVLLHYTIIKLQLASMMVISRIP